MSLSSDNNTVMTMPVQPAYGNGYGNGSMWGGDWASWIILFLIFGAFSNGGWGNGFGGFGRGDSCGCCSPATCSDLQSGFNNQAVTNKLNGLENGLCSLGYDQLAQMNGINTNILNTGYGIQNAIQQAQFAQQTSASGLQAQLADCCCTTQRAIDGMNYNLATQSCDTRNTIQNTTRDIIDSQNSGIQAIMGKLSQMEYNSLNDKYQAALAENQALKFQASQTAQNAFIAANQEAQTAEILRRTGHDCPTAAYVVQPPTPVTFPNWCNTCNTGCGC